MFHFCVYINKMSAHTFTSPLKQLIVTTEAHNRKTNLRLKTYITLQNTANTQNKKSTRENKLARMILELMHLTLTCVGKNKQTLKKNQIKNPPT